MSEYSCKLDELEKLLNDPDTQLEAERVWSLLAEIARMVPEQAEAALPR